MKPVMPFRSAPALRLVVLFTLFFFFILIAGGVGAALKFIPGISERTAFLLSAFSQGILAFCIPAWFTARFSTDHPWRFLGIIESVTIRPFLGVLIVYVLALPAMNQLIEWNQSIHLPEWASGMESMLRDLEEEANDATGKMLQIDTPWELISTIFVVGIVTGFSEELFFRGTLQKIFMQSKILPWCAIWATAFIFSAMHFQFFGFIPRLIMGAFFGYVFMWSGSLWPAVFAHALNNSLVVVSAYISGGDLGSGIDSFGVSAIDEFPVTALFSILATGLFLWKFRNYFFKTISVNGKEI